MCCILREDMAPRLLKLKDASLQSLQIVYSILHVSLTPYKWLYSQSGYENHYFILCWCHNVMRQWYSYLQCLHDGKKVLWVCVPEGIFMERPKVAAPHPFKSPLLGQSGRNTTVKLSIKTVRWSSPVLLVTTTLIKRIFQFSASLSHSLLYINYI